MFRIRFHGRGGQGIKTAGRILGSALFREGFQVQDAPRYGAERRGAPIFSFVRAGQEPIRERGGIACADLVVVADETLIGDPSAGVLLGLDAHTVLFVISGQAPATWKSRLHTEATILTLPPAGPAAPQMLADVGARCAGAAACLLGMIRAETLAEAVRGEIGVIAPKRIEAEIAAAREAYDAVIEHRGCVTAAKPAAAFGPVPRWIELAFDPVELAAPAIHRAATSALINTGSWRLMRPVVDRSRCHRCIWVCGSYCPDNAIGLDAAGFPRIDYDHCKGCLICVAQCPTHAIEAIPERHDA
jgi:pyruvate ferredoxin oxidoreductase gamma subunit